MLCKCYAESDRWTRADSTHSATWHNIRWICVLFCIRNEWRVAAPLILSLKMLLFLGRDRSGHGDDRLEIRLWQTTKCASVIASFEFDFYEATIEICSSRVQKKKTNEQTLFWSSKRVHRICNAFHCGCSIFLLHTQTHIVKNQHLIKFHRTLADEFPFSNRSPMVRQWKARVCCARASTVTIGRARVSNRTSVWSAAAQN